jgi:glycosyltransferase 2 family protein
MSVNHLNKDISLTITSSDSASGFTQFKSAKPFFWVQLAVFLGGLSLLFFVIYYIGFQIVLEALKRVGWGFLLIIGLNGARHILRALCCYLAIPRQHRTVNFFQMFAARLGGDAVSVLTFTGPLLGEATKAALLKRRVPLSHGVAALVVDNILYDISVVLMILIGVGTLLYTYVVGDNAVLGILIGTAIVTILGVTGLLLLFKYRIKPISWLINKFSERKWLPRIIVNKKDKVLEIENNIYEFYLHQRASFFYLIGINILAHTLSVCEVYLALYMLGFTTSFVNAFIIEALTKVINFVFSFVPGLVGVYEGGTGVILKTLGYATATGVMLALVRKASILFWTCIGLIILLFRAMPKNSE